MTRKKIQLPQGVHRAFLDVARGNIDSQGCLKETLAFLAGHETSDTLMVTDIIFPVQEATTTKVDDKGICGQDSSLWMSQRSPAAQSNKEEFRLIAWVHSHVEGAPCGFSSVDVHTQYAYKVMCNEWEVYGLVIEIKEDKSCVTGWYDLTEEGMHCVSQCPTTQTQHGQCSKRSFFQDHNYLVSEAELPLTVVDGRHTTPIGHEQTQNDPVIWTINAQRSLETLYKEHDVCKSCGKYLGCLQSMVGHIGRAKKCKMFYGPEYDFMRSKRRRECVKAYNRSNAAKIAQKQAEYDKTHKEQIKKKQLRYDRECREDKKTKQAEYNHDNQAKIKKKQAEYNLDNRARIKKKQAEYNQDNRATINKKQAEYNQDNRAKINKKQAEYNQDNRATINKKQAEYNQDNRATINKKQAEYNQDNRATINKKQAKYNQDNRTTVNKKQEQYNKDNKEAINKKQAEYNQINRVTINKRQAEYNQDNQAIINKKQSVYNQDNRSTISQKQKLYDQDHRATINEKQRKYNQENKSTIKRKQAQYDNSHKDQINKKQAKYNEENRDKIVANQGVYNIKHKEQINTKQSLYNLKNRKDIAEKEKKRKQAQKKPLQDFNTQISNGPIFPCSCCHRLLFPDGVVKYNSPEELKAAIGSQLYCDAIKILPMDNNHVYLCANCNLLLKKRKMPAISVSNGLCLDEIPDELKLTELEQQLIAKRLLFLKIHFLPRSRMQSMKDRVINVPLEDEDICITMKTLPRNVKKAGLIGVKFKRMKQLKSNHLQAFIRPGVPQKAIKTLKDLGHPDYQFEVQDYQENSLSSSDTNTSEDESSCDNEDTEQEAEDSPNTGVDCGVKKSQIVVEHELYNASTSLVHDNLESEVILNQGNTTKFVHCGKNTIEIAPGEGKVPTNILHEQNIDIKAFPSLFPRGRFGCDYERKVKLSKQKYYNQRILNVDSRFRQSSTYLFAAQHIVEREQLEKNINLMVQRGQMRTQEDGSHVMKTSDHYAAFQNIRGSPKYFQTAKNELLARVAQLGPFQLFFTLSCAEMRWPEVITTLLQESGHHVDCIDEDNLEYTVDGQGLESFLETYEGSKHDLFKKNILTVTRMFDHRVKKFVQHILKSSRGSVAVEYYNYRIEFQMRGMAHVHGVIWLDENQLKEFKLPGTTQYNSDKIPQLIDSLITCQVPEDDEKLKRIVLEVQTHRHTKTCQKYNSSCRFGYPRFPSKRTLVANTLPCDMNDHEQEKIIKKYKDTLKRVKTVLENEENLDSCTIDNLLSKAGVSFDDYEKALSTSERGINIVLKRDVSECFINNYNPTWLKAWNGNMDLQFCYDPYAVITYICDYYGKDDSGMTDLLKKALRKTHGEGRHEILLALKRTYLTHRQIGACEAAYRLLPNLHLKDSNVTCTFVSTGFPENRATFMEKVHDYADEENENTTEPSSNYVKIEGKNGLFKKRISIHERYAQRPKSLDKICLAQFATMYKLATYQRKNIVMKNNSSELTGNTKIYLTETNLPFAIQFDNKAMSPMQLRGRSSVLRLHESKKKKEEHEFYYAELLLFHPWRNEIVDLYRSDAKKCKRLYKKHFLAIYDRRKIMFPFLDSVEEAQARLEEVSLEQFRPNHIANTLDPEGEHENEAQKQEIDIDEVTIHHPGDFQQSAIDSTHKDFTQFKIVEVDLPEMMQLTRSLIPEQRDVLDKVVMYCKTMARSQICGSNPPDPFRIILHGGAGSGKSNVIKIVAKWAEKILRKPGDHPNKPRILLTAPTGTAASIIGGITLHSAFNFSFGDELKPLSDKKLDEIRCSLSDVKIVIIDEISMIRSDMLYQLHLRLCQIFQSKRLFGGKSIMLVGDLLQLQPVRGSYIFEAPRCQHYKPYHDISPLWQEFEVFQLNHNHRQGNAGQWAETLNRFRVGEVTEADLNLLKEKILCEEEAKQKESACHLFFTNKEVDCHNAKMLNKITNELHVIKAAVTVPFGCRSKLQTSGRVDQTAFMDTLNIKIGARVMLIHNLNVVDNLTNGAMGKVVDIRLQEGKPHCIIVTFDNEDIGIQQRRNHENIAKLYKDKVGTPIFKAEIQYQLPKGKGGTKQHTATGKLYQFPLRLAWAVTAHKVQGQTFKKNSQIVVHWHKNLVPGMAYVMLGRCESPDDVFISGDFNKKGIRCNEKAKEMTEELQVRSSEVDKNIWKYSKSLKLVLINARSLEEHAIDIAQCKEYTETDILCVTETWLKHGKTIKLDPFTNATFASPSVKRGKGCAIFSKHNMPGRILAEQLEFQCIKLQTPSLQIVLVYRSNKQSISMLIRFLETHVDFSKPSVLLGDFNIHAESHNVLKDMLHKFHLVQKVKEPTHDCGNILDHVYISEALALLSYTSLVPVTFSDHDLVKIEIAL